MLLICDPAAEAPLLCTLIDEHWACACHSCLSLPGQLSASSQLPDTRVMRARLDRPAHGTTPPYQHVALSHFQPSTVPITRLSPVAGQKPHLTDRAAHHLCGPPPQLIRAPVRELREQVVNCLIILLALKPAECGADAGTSNVCLRSCTTNRVKVTKLYNL